MEELNSESTRKRPRLDSGSGANCTHDSASMTTPTTPAETSEDTQDSQQDLQTPQNQVDNTPGTIKEGAVGTPAGCSVHGGGPPTAGEDQDGMPITPLPAASTQKSMNGSPVVPPRPSSRVTINMKSPSSETAQSQATPEDGEATASSTEKQAPAIETGNNVSKPELEPIPQLDGESAVFQTSSNPTVNHDIHSSIPMERTTIVIPDSPSSAASVEIEVADPEDMDQDPATTSWRPLDDAIRAPREPEVVQIHEETSLAEAFPNFRAAYNIRECVLDMKAAMERGQ